MRIEGRLSQKGSLALEDSFEPALLDGIEMTATARIYRMKSSQRIGSVILLLFGLVFTSGVWGSILFGSREPKLLDMMFPIAYSLVAAIFTWRSFKNRVRLSKETVELHSLSGTRVLPISSIKCRRRYLSRGDTNSPDVWHLVLESEDDRYPKIDLEELYRFDEQFYRWFNALPDLDEIDKTRPKTSKFRLGIALNKM